MIKVRITKNELIEEIVITGHANYSDFGKDIVCSSVSSIVITTVNGIDKLDNSYLTVDELTDKLVIKINKNNDDCYKLILNMVELLEELERQYPKNVNVK